MFICEHLEANMIASTVPETAQMLDGNGRANSWVTQSCMFSP